MKEKKRRIKRTLYPPFLLCPLSYEYIIMLSPHSHTWHKMAESAAEIDFQANNLTELEIHGKRFCIGQHDGQLFACTQKCPHAGGVLSEGYIDAAGNLVCPLHRYKFNPKNGRNISGEGYFLKTFLIEEREDGVFICFEG